MRTLRTIIAVLACTISLAAIAQNSPAFDAKTDDGGGKLPVRRVVLYKNGVGYFEHGGRVRDDQQVSINFTTAQLNDVLKSLTVLDRGNGHITGVSYNSTAPIEQRLRSLRLPVEQDTTAARFLEALRGARIEVRGDTNVAVGRLLSVESREIKNKDESTHTVDTISLITDTGELRSFDLAPATGVRILDRDLTDEVGRYLNVISTAREQDVRRMTIATSGSGERDLLVSYISEVPVWKSTYRIVLPEKSQAKPLLQGWAIVDNTVGEDWKNVELSLVAGAPQSFVQQLSTPFYARRPVVAVPELAMLTPQTHEQALISGSKNGAVQSMPVAPPPAAPRRKGGVVGGVPGGVPGGQMGGVVGGILSESPGIAGKVSGDMYRTDAASLVDELERQQSAANAREAGDLFEYKLKEPVTIRKDQSALVPIVQAHVDAEKVTLWSSSSGRPLRALWLTNSSGLTLDGGSFNVLEAGTFSGEGLMDALKPGEKRLLSYAADLGVIVESKRDSEAQRVARVRVARGLLTYTTEIREHRTYTVRNEDTTVRNVIIEHPARPNMKLAATSPKPEETTASSHRFRLTIEPKQTATLTVEEVQPVSSTYELTNVNDDLIGSFVRQRAIDAAAERALHRIVSQKNALAALDAQIEARNKEVTSIFDDQQRVRENLKALKGSAEEKILTERYTRQLNQQEDRVQMLRAQVTDLRGKRDQAKTALDHEILDLTLEASL